MTYSKPEIETQGHALTLVRNCDKNLACEDSTSATQTGAAYELDE